MTKATKGVKGVKAVKNVAKVSADKKSTGPRKITIRSQKEVAKPSVVTVSFRREIEIANVKGHEADLKTQLKASFERYLDLKLQG